MPKSYKNLEKLSKFLLAVLSLRRLVFSNCEKMNLILKEKQREEVELLNFEDNDNLNLKYDSPYNPNEYDVEDDNHCKMDGALEEELLKKD